MFDFVRKPFLGEPWQERLGEVIDRPPRVACVRTANPESMVDERGCAWPGMTAFRLRALSIASPLGARKD